MLCLGLDSYRPEGVSNALYRKVLSRWCYILFIGVRFYTRHISIGLHAIGPSGIGDRGVGQNILLLKVG